MRTIYRVLSDPVTYLLFHTHINKMVHWVCFTWDGWGWGVIGGKLRMYNADVLLYRQCYSTLGNIMQIKV